MFNKEITHKIRCRWWLTIGAIRVIWGVGNFTTPIDTNLHPGVRFWLYALEAKRHSSQYSGIEKCRK